MEKRLNPEEFAAFLTQRAAAKDGYILCTTGQDPKSLNKWYYEQYDGKQLEKALYWQAHAQRVWDCQGLADGYVSEMTGEKVNVRARNNYSDWCAVKGEGSIPPEHRRAGAAVFMHNGDYISHVGFLVRPVQETLPEGDWFVVEARGVMYGVVTTRLHSRKWNRWGLMTRYFDYGLDAQPEVNRESPPLLRKGMSGEAVAALQRDLISLGYSCGQYGADGEFGSATRLAVKAFQQDYGLEADGIAGPQTHAMLERLMPENGEVQPSPASKDVVRIARGSWNVRSAPSIHAPIRGYAQGGQVYAAGKATAEGWACIVFGGEEAWVSRKGVMA